MSRILARQPATPAAPNDDLNRFHYAAAAYADPENAGTFVVRDGRLVIDMGWQYRHTIVAPLPDRDGRVIIEQTSFTRERK